MEEPQSFTNRELWMLVKGNNDTNLLQHQALKSSIEEFHKNTEEMLKSILAQATKTNGRVNKLELWQSYVRGSTWIIPIVVSAVVGGIVTLILRFIK